jgi:hypothetical protein
MISKVRSTTTTFMAGVSLEKRLVGGGKWKLLDRARIPNSLNSRSSRSTRTIRRRSIRTEDRQAAARQRPVFYPTIRVA